MGYLKFRNKVRKFFGLKEFDYVDGLRVVRDEEKPWLCYCSPPFWTEYSRLTLTDTKHPDWRKHMEEMYDKYNHIFEEIIEK